MASLSDKAGILIAANFMKYAVGFIMPMMLVRMLSKSDYGTLQQIQLIGNIAVGVMALGLPSSIFYFHRKDQPVERLALVQQTVWMLLASGLVTGVALAFTAPLFSASLNNPAVAVFLPIFAVSVGLGVAGEHFVPFMIAQDRYATAVMFETGEAVVRVAMLVVPLLMGLGLPGLIWAIVAVALGRLVLREWWLLRSVDWQLRPAPGTTFVGAQLQYSLPMLATALVGLLGEQFDRVLIATSFSPAEYATYVVGALSIPLDTIFQAAVANVMRATLPALAREGRYEEMIRLLREAVRKLSIVVLPSFVFLYGYSHEFIVLLFTSNYADSVQVFRIYLWLMPLQMMMLSPIPQAFGKTKINMYLVAVTMFIHAVASLVLLKWMGYLGPAVSAIITNYILSAGYAVMGGRLLKMSPLRLLPMAALARVIGAAVAALAASRLVFQMVGSVNLLGFALAGLIFTVAFLAAGAIVGVFTPQDRAMGKRWLERLRLVRT